MESSEIGKKGEDVVCEYLKSKGHRISDRNFRMRFGEIDIISEKGDVTYFVEVKTVAQDSDLCARTYKAEERVGSRKTKKLSRVIQHYLLNVPGGERREWEFWVVAVTLNLQTKTAVVKVIPETIGS